MPTHGISPLLSLAMSGWQRDDDSVFTVTGVDREELKGPALETLKVKFLSFAMSLLLLERKYAFGRKKRESAPKFENWRAFWLLVYELDYTAVIASETDQEGCDRVE